MSLADDNPVVVADFVAVAVVVVAVIELEYYKCKKLNSCEIVI